jgi:hypothetical protein
MSNVRSQGNATVHDLLTFLTAKPDVANAISAFASTIVALAAMVISLVSLFVAARTLKHQRNHNILSVRPIPMVSTADHEDHLSIELKNTGSGPLIIRGIAITGASPPRTYLRECMPSLPDGLSWKTYVGPLKGESLGPGEAVTLLELVGDPTDTTFSEFRDRCRQLLGALSVEIDHTDIYGSERPMHEHSLVWYARKRAIAPPPANATR